MESNRSDLRECLKEPLFRNWVAAVLMLDSAKDALQKFCIPVIEEFLENIKQKGPSGPLCGRCSFQSNGMCNNPSTCPGLKLRAEIKREHRFGQPTFCNTTMHECLNDPWAVAKCYMPEDYHDKTLETTDITGFLNLVINNTLFPHHIDDGEHPASKENVFFKARKVRNAVMHSSPLEMKETLLNDNMRVLVRMLKSFRPMPALAAIDAIEKLEHHDITEQDVVAAYKLRLSALKEFQKELKETIPKITEQLNILCSNAETATNGVETTPVPLSRYYTRSKQPSQDGNTKKRRLAVEVM